MPVEFCVLGPVGVRIDGRAVDVGHARQQYVLAALLVDVNRAVPADRLLERVWGDRPPHSAHGTLNTYLSRLRRVLAPAPDAVIGRFSNGYMLTADAMAVDLHRFNRLAEQARMAEDDEEASALLARALGLWRGEAFATLDTPWLNATRESLDARRLAVELDRNDVELRRGQHGELLGELSAAAAEHPWDERLAGQLMLALYRCGRQADAMDVYQRMRVRLAEELGADPSPPLGRLHHQVLTADPAIAVPVSSTGTGDRRPPLAPVPRQLPASPGSFTGRIAELAELNKVMDAQRDGAAAVVISAIGGTGGIGKTWLALRWAHDNAERFPDGQLYVNLRGFDPSDVPVTSAVAVRQFLDAMGVDPARIPVDPDAQAGLYRSLVAGKQMLIVLDNARDSSTVGPLLPGTATSAVLVTSRHQLAGLVTAHGARPLVLDVMPESEARELLVRHLGAERMAAEPQAVDVLLQRCAGLPLALGIIAARAALQPDRSLTALGAELHTAATRLDALDAGELTANLRAVLACSHQAMAPELTRAFGLLGLALGPDISLAAAASLTALPVAAIRGVLRQLGAAHLVQEHVPGRYRMHDLVRLYAAELAGRDQAAGDAAVRRLLDHYLHTAYRAALLLSPHRDPLTLPEASAGVDAEDIGDLADAMTWFATERRVLLAAVRHAGESGFDVHACQLPWTLATFFDRQGHWDDWVSVGHTALDAAHRLADRAEQAQAHRLLANAYSNLRRYDQANFHLGTALNLFDELGDRAACAHTHFDLAMLFDRQGRPRDALRHALQTLELYEAVGTPVKRAVALNAVGWYHSQLGEHADAVRYCQQALALSRQIGNTYAQANTWDSLGYAHHHLGDHQQAAACYREAIDLFQGMGDRHAGAIALDHLGDTHAAAGDSGSARESWRSALDALDELGHPDADEVRAKLR